MSLTDVQYWFDGFDPKVIYRLQIYGTKLSKREDYVWKKYIFMSRCDALGVTGSVPILTNYTLKLDEKFINHLLDQKKNTIKSLP